jgi:hypothetical protein
MGKTKKFIEKGSSTKFVLLHRSQQDAEYGKEGASSLVLVPADDPGLSARVEQVIASKRDHINSLGFANDGYDYDQHFRTIGGSGLFLSKTGKIAAAPILPPEALASTEEEFDRQLDAITIRSAGK